jgi:hypothetical protein
MKRAVLLIIFVAIVAFAAGVIVIHRQNDHTCVRYYAKDGSHELSTACK